MLWKIILNGVFFLVLFSSYFWNVNFSKIYDYSFQDVIQFMKATSINHLEVTDKVAY